MTFVSLFAVDAQASSPNSKSTSAAEAGSCSRFAAGLKACSTLVVSVCAAPRWALIIDRCRSIFDCKLVGCCVRFSALLGPTAFPTKTGADT
jgi:hypothetical protein